MVIVRRPDVPRFCRRPGVEGNWRPVVLRATNSYHLSESAARALIERAVASYVERAGALPRELFVHGKARFDDDEWRGLTSRSPEHHERRWRADPSRGGPARLSARNESIAASTLLSTRSANGVPLGAGIHPQALDVSWA